MIYWEIFLAFFIPGIVGYGGGPPSIPLIEHEVVHRYSWMTVEQFGEIIALGNALPGPIATKTAGYVGYQAGGVLGAFVALLATIAPSLLAMIFLLSLLYKFKDSPRIKQMVSFVKPAIAILLGILAYRFIFTSWENTGMIQTFFISIFSLLLLEKWKIHPAYVIIAALVLGGILGFF